MKMTKQSLRILFVIMILLVTYNKSSSIGIPTASSLLGEEIASNIASECLQQISNDLSRSAYKNYKKDLKKFEKKLRKLIRKHTKIRMKEVRKIEILLDDLNRYKAGDPDVNKKQDQKQKNLRYYIIQFQKNDKIRANEIKQFRNRYYPRINSYIKTF